MTNTVLYYIRIINRQSIEWEKFHRAQQRESEIIHKFILQFRIQSESRTDDG